MLCHVKSLLSCGSFCSELSTEWIFHIIPYAKINLYSSCGTLIQNIQSNFCVYSQQREARPEWRRGFIVWFVRVPKGAALGCACSVSKVAMQGGLAGINSNYPSLLPFAPEKHPSAGKRMNANLIIQPTLAALGSEKGNIPFALPRWSLPCVHEWMSMKMRIKSNLFSPSKFCPTQFTEARAKCRHPNSTDF